MKINRQHIILAVTVLLIGAAFLSTAGIAYAQAGNPDIKDAGGGSTLTRFLGATGVPQLVNSVLGLIVYAILTAASWLMTLAAAILNVSMVLTLNIREFVDATPAIYIIWQTIRDISGLFFIFFLLYAAIQIILGLGNNYGNLIKKIVIAGILINFSFFIVSVAIDASNVVSQAIYNAIVGERAGAVTIDGQSTLSGLTSKVTGVGDPKAPNTGISNIFMNSLKIQSFFKEEGTMANLDTSFKIIFIGAAGVIMMLTTALSFILAAAAFAVRLIILLFLLAFSPLWFAAEVIPQLKGQFDFKGTLFSQLIFMPVYLLLMYAALTILNSSQMFGAATATTSVFATGTNWSLSYIVLAVNFAMVIIMLNLPLFIGLKMGGMATGWLGSAMGKADAINIWKNIGNWGRRKTYEGATGTYQQTAGRVASRLGRSESFQKFAGNYKIGELALKATRGAGKTYDMRLDEKVKAKEEFAKSLDRRAAADYAQRLSGSIPARLSIFHTIGRSDRVGAARILKNRLDEVTTDVNKLTGELNQINNAAGSTPGGLGALPLYQRQRHDLLSGLNATGINTAGKNEIIEAQNDLNNIRTQLQAFQAQTGASIKDTSRRNY